MERSGQGFGRTGMLSDERTGPPGTPRTRRTEIYGSTYACRDQHAEDHMDLSPRAKSVTTLARCLGTQLSHALSRHAL